MSLHSLILLEELVCQEREHSHAHVVEADDAQPEAETLQKEEAILGRPIYESKIRTRYPPMSATKESHS